MDTLKWGKPNGLPLFFGFILKTILSFMCKHLPFQMYTIMVMQQDNTVRLQNFYVARLESDNMATATFYIARCNAGKTEYIGTEISYPDIYDTYVSRAHAVLDHFAEILKPNGLYIVWADSWYSTCEVATSPSKTHGATVRQSWATGLDTARYGLQIVNLDHFTEEVKDYLGA